MTPAVRFAALAVATLSAVAATPATAASGHPTMITVAGADAVRWTPAPAALPKGIEISVIMGDPDKPGPFALRLRIPAGTVIAPHTHATDETVTLLTGSLVHDMGEKRVESRGEPFAEGGFLYLPANMPHSLWTKGEAAVIQVNGTGPFGLNYVNPADDPSKAGR
ncbi:cupin domain-containing protein [Hansschlegelia zhihuaiae]|uniref:Cupin domain-containing protein n=1 Tax=Hansschlegelia zhihuaiae TaxID=405005 RepID=A0A4Q0MHV2_9HYPH|nr:cupin domain-containing protein [Hansschlegelia zhihuaiae]RXF72985.1 cupin domain-containing protein [Hansschlegelia zhihuaiae]